jgi:hypothetical protein
MGHWGLAHTICSQATNQSSVEAAKQAKMMIVSMRNNRNLVSLFFKFGQESAKISKNNNFVTLHAPKVSS